jgi:Amt family ammonium transporter
VAVLSGGVHYLFSVSLIESSMQAQMHNVLVTSRVYLERAYQVPVSGELRLLEASPVVDRLLVARGPERLLERLAAERVFLSVIRANPGRYRSLVLFDVDAEPVVATFDGKRVSPALFPTSGGEQELFAALAAERPGTVRYSGPVRHADGRYSMLVGVAKSDPDIAGFGGAIIAQAPLTDFARHISGVEVLGHKVVWLLDGDGEILSAPTGASSRLDPRPYLSSASEPPDGGVIMSSPPGDAYSPLGLFRVVLSMPGDVYAQSLSHAGVTAVAVLAVVALMSALMALVLARQITHPIRTLAGMSASVARGDFSKRVPIRGGGEMARLGRVFNQMLDALNATTVSRVYVDQIVESMNDAVLVVDGQGVIENVNRAASALLSRSIPELVGKTHTSVFNDGAVRRRIDEALQTEAPLEDVHTVLTRADGEQVPVWLSCSPMRDRDGRYGGMVLVARDLSEHLRAQRELEVTHQALDFHVNNSPLAVIEWDSAFRIKRWSGRAEELFGWTSAEVLGRTSGELHLVYEADLGLTRATGRQLDEGLPRNVCRNRNVRKDGRIVHCEWHNSLLMGPDGEPVSVLSLVQDVTESAVLSAELSYQANHDPLTGLMNRRAFDSKLEEALGSAVSTGVCHALCFVDMDQFKVVNDSCGHLAGDELLRQVGGVLKGAVRKRDTVGRMGGDEFAVLMEDCSMEAARRVALDILRAFREHPFIWDEKSFRIGASIGLVPVTGSDMDRTSLMTAADAACLAAKDEGRDRVHVFAEQQDLRRRRGEAEWVTRINRALEQDRFFLVAQPIVPSAGTGPTDWHELLLRMSDEDGKVITPGAFLPSAERYHLMPTLDRWVIRTAIELLARGPVDGRVLFVNISGQTLADESLTEFVSEHLQRCGVSAGSLCFEITETAAVSNLARAQALIRQLSRLGCMFALDDFGAGVSSFAYLKNLPVHLLKIDGMFVRDMVSDASNRALVCSINEVGRAMGKRTVAEFVEDEATLELLRSLGVDFVQGFHVGAPVPATGALLGAPELRVVGS